ncbi:hypothetical protein ACJX0J_031242 [Zea mays]
MHNPHMHKQRQGINVDGKGHETGRGGGQQEIEGIIYVIDIDLVVRVIGKIQKIYHNMKVAPFYIWIYIWIHIWWIIWLVACLYEWIQATGYIHFLHPFLDID